MITNNVETTELIHREDLKAFQGKFKKENPLEIEMLAGRIAKHGFSAPVFVWSGKDYILDGHQRIKALDLLSTRGDTLQGDMVPVVHIRAENEKEARMRVAEFNSKFSDIDPEYAMEWLKDVDMENLPIIGFEMPTMTDAEKEETEDEVPSIEKPVTVKKGDVFRLGQHMLMCGDSTSQDDLAVLMAGDKAQLVFTDPPYNVSYEGSGKNTSRTIENDSMTPAQFDTFLDAFFQRYAENVANDCPLYVFHGAVTAKQFQLSMERTGFEVIESIVWNKPSAGMGMNDYRRKHEPFFYAKRKGQKIPFYGDRCNTSVWDFTKTDEQLMKQIKEFRASEEKGCTTVWSMRRDSVNEYVHPTQKPVELIGHAIENSSKKGDLVLDLFAGSGSTLIACEKHKRVCRTMELDPTFVEIIVKRYAQYADPTQIECLNREIDISELIR